MNTTLINKMLMAALVFLLSTTASEDAHSQVGVFDHSADIGKVFHKGSARYDAAKDQYDLTGAGANMWFGKDEFHYLYKKMTGDFILQAQAAFVGKGTDMHRKFGWMIRNSLDTSSAMVSAQVHGDGLTSLQYRKTTGANVEEKRSSIKAPDVVQLERRGNRYIMSTAHFGEAYVVEEYMDSTLNNEVYVGIFVCSHNKDVVEEVLYDNVRINVPAKSTFTPYRDYIGSRIETMDVTSGKRMVEYTEPVSLQAPNWTLDGKSLIYNSGGLIYKLDLATKKPIVINTGFVKSNNNDHVISFDGKMLGLSSSSGDKKYGSMVYVVPINGGVPTQVTPVGPSYLHGFSPDGKYVIYTAQRNNDFDIYKKDLKGGDEVNLTNFPGLDDGSEYSPDGKYIYFNSTRSGLMQLWRMKPDGSQQEQLTFDEYNNWFPHISPDGKMIAFLTFGKDVKPDDHPFYKHVYLRLMPVAGGKPTVIAYLYGGQGSINTPSWSPDSKKIAFVSNTDFSE
ncbi:MAG: biopolymer transporter TolR [Chitinophagaceae bacterium]|nr:biopolymer transporter TolR [Chitinophagaceae bacterium]